MQLTQEFEQKEEVTASGQSAQEHIQNTLRSSSWSSEVSLRERATMALLLLQSAKPQLPQPKPILPRTDEPIYVPPVTPSGKTPENLRFIPGQETLLICRANPAVSYRIYWPKTKKAVAQLKDVMLMIPAGGSAPILSKKLADEFGWVMIGLQKTTYNQGELAGAATAVIKDFEARLKHPLIWRFAGFSAGGYAASAVAQTYQNRCAGLFMMGSSWYFTGQTPKYPVVFLVGAQDFNRASGERDFAQVQKLRVPSLLISPNAGHTMGNVSEQERAIRFLATHYTQP